MLYALPIIASFRLGGLFVRKVYGIENLPKSGGFILAANHDSYLDPFIIMASLISSINHRVHWLAMKGRFWDFFGDRISRNWSGCVPLDEGKEKALKELTEFLKKGDSVGIFPGGPRSPDGNLTKGKTGISRLVLGAKVPVIPVGLIGTYEIAPKERLIPRLKRADVKIGKPMYFKKYYNKKVTKKILIEIVDEVMKEIARLTKKRYNPK
jgi:1-acyl-sn-glycerol-3-phosphate acyltransferase